jgi:hypothetical protein
MSETVHSRCDNAFEGVAALVRVVRVIRLGIVLGLLISPGAVAG